MHFLFYFSRFTVFSQYGQVGLGPIRWRYFIPAVEGLYHITISYRLLAPDMPPTMPKALTDDAHSRVQGSYKRISILHKL